MGTKWQMPIAVIGKPTGDGRQFDEGALGHRDLPLPFRYVAEDSGGHANAVIVGHISKIGKEKDGLLPAEGEFYDDDEWPEDVRNASTAARMFVDKKVIGPSVDLDQQEVEHVPEPKAYAAWKKEQAGKLKAAKLAHAKTSGSDCGCGDAPAFAEEAYDGPRLRVIRSGRMASATLVHIPAFAELSGHATLTPIDSSDPNVAGTTSSAKIENDAEMAICTDKDGKKVACDDDEEDTVLPNRKKRSKKAAAVNQDDEEFTAWVDFAEGTGIWLSDDDFAEFAKRRLPSKSKADQPEMQGTDGEQAHGAAFADVTKADVRKKLDDADFVDPDGRRFPIASCSDISDAVSSYGRANPKIPMAQFKSRLTVIAKRKGCEGSLPESWKAGEKMAALMAGAAPAAPPRSWFDDPKLTGPTPLTIGDDGRVFGHVATWGTCHVGIGDSCVQPPKSRTAYAYFHTGEVVCDDGSRVPVGRLSYGGGHAAPKLGYRAAAEHYDSTSHMGAQVCAGEDEFGIWVAGAVVPEADEAALRVMRATPLSGDWRRIGGNLEMMAALHVNTPGFPIPRVMTASGADQELLSLVAAGALVRGEEAEHELTASVDVGLDMEALGRAVARGMLAETEEAERRKAMAAEWNELVAASTASGIAADYDEALGYLTEALVE